MIIVQISDTHIDPESDKNRNRLRDLQLVVKDINRLRPFPDAVIHTGDVVHNGTQEKYNSVLDIFDKLEAPLYICAGNRDSRSLIKKNFLNEQRISPVSDFIQYCVDDYPVRLIALDTLSASSNMGDYCQERANNLEKILRQASRKPTVLFMHHPPFRVMESKYPFQFNDWGKIDLLGYILKKNRNVKQIFCGHSHRNSRGKIANVPAGTVSSVAVDLRLGDVPKGAESIPIYQIHKFDGTRFKSDIRVCET